MDKELFKLDQKIQDPKGLKLLAPVVGLLLGKFLVFFLHVHCVHYMHTSCRCNIHSTLKKKIACVPCTLHMHGMWVQHACNLDFNLCCVCPLHKHMHMAHGELVQCASDPKNKNKNKKILCAHCMCCMHKRVWHMAYRCNMHQTKKTKTK